MSDESDMPVLQPSDLLVAGALLTRLPLPKAAARDFDRAARAAWAYPVIGLVVGALGALIWWGVGVFGLGTAVQAGVALVALVMMTGALHEDGLADTADGLWGGHDPARRLEIMKDSRIGSYGVIALVLGLGLRWVALASAGPVALIAAASLSRGVLPAVMARVPMARPDGLARAQGTPPDDAAWLALGIGSAAAFLLGGLAGGLVAILLAIVAAAALAKLACAKIGGLTGDILGATQQLCELLVLLVFVTLH